MWQSGDDMSEDMSCATPGCSNSEQGGCQSFGERLPHRATAPPGLSTWEVTRLIPYGGALDGVRGRGIMEQAKSSGRHVEPCIQVVSDLRGYRR